MFNLVFISHFPIVLRRDLKGEAERGMSYVIGSKALYDSLERNANNPRFQRLVIDYKQGEDPDDAFRLVE